MSLSQHSARFPSLPAAPRPALRRRRRVRLTTVQLWLRWLEIGAFMGCGAGITLALPAPYGALPLSWGLLAACVAALVALQLPPLLEGPLARWGALVAPLGTSAAALALQGAPWQAAAPWEAGYGLSTVLALAGLRTASGQVLGRMLAAGQLATRVAVVGAGPAASRVMARLRQCDPGRIDVIGRYADGPDQDLDRPRGTLRTLLMDCRLGTIDAIVLASEPGDADGLLRLRRALRPCIQDVYFCSELIEHAGPEARAGFLGATPLLLVSQAPIRGWPGAVKRVLDQAGAWLLLAFMAPLLGVIALAIKLESPGPVLFRQLRVGYNNRLFYILKFRSMRHDAADRLAKQQTVYGDTRVTRAGRLIRRLSLDELPQLLNVVRGEMSLVGPRPHAPGTSIGGQRVHHLADDYAVRHLVRPGITGLAQVRGLRGGLQTRRQVQDRLAADLEYVRHWSLWLDAKVLLLTFVLELRGSRGF